VPRPPDTFTTLASAPLAISLPQDAIPGVRALPAPDPAIALWMCQLDRIPEGVAAITHWLSPAEHARAARFGTDALRQRWIVGRATLRLLLASELGIDPAQVPLRRGVRGRPELVDPHTLDFNVSHTRDIALIAIAHGLPRASRIGVDIERVGRTVNADRLALKFLTERERAALAPLDADARRRGFLRLWTCKEAMSKATGDALMAPFREIDVSTRDGLQLSAGPPPYTPEQWRLFAADVAEDLLATVAVWRLT
jgi:4'-phosphopantetheinyl transferase